MSVPDEKPNDSRGQLATSTESATIEASSNVGEQEPLLDQTNDSIAKFSAGNDQEKDTDASMTGHNPAQDSIARDKEETAAAQQPNLCGVCNDKPGKYKCTRCRLPFCSVACNKIHKENHPPDPEPEPEPVAPPATEGTPAPSKLDPRNPFSMLDNSDQLRYLFRRYPSLPQQLLDIYAATEPPSEAQPSNIKEAILARAAAAAKPKSEQWNHDVGIRKGKEALRKARKAGGDDGEGIREFSELIIHLTSQSATNDEADVHLRGQAAQRDTDLIRRLMEEDGRR